MNYLAHIVLSGDRRRVQVGNFVGDAVKGRVREDLPPGIREGVLLHRRIDDYTDHHPAVREVVARLRGEFGRYAGVVADIYFDHFLASGFRRYAGRSLRPYALGFYVTLVANYRHLPARFKGFLWHFILTDRLTRYASPRGVRRSLEIMVEYKHLGVDPDRAIAFLGENRVWLLERFERFWPEVREMCRAELENEFSINYIKR